MGGENGYGMDYLFVPVAEMQELPPGERLFLQIGELPIVVFNLAGKVFAIGDVCTHDEGPLGDGDLDGHQIICPRHGARFDLKTGKALTLPAVQATPSYPVRINNNKIELGLPKS